MQATLEREQLAPKRKFYIHFKIEVGMRPISAEPRPEPTDRLTEAHRQEWATQHAAAMREAAFRRHKLG